MTVELRDIAVPDFGLPLARPLPPAATYSARCDRLVRDADADWVVVYADREHLANMVFLTGFEPRFEEALLLLGRKGERIVICGNESLNYTAVARLPGLDARLCQSFSLMGQDRSTKPNLETVLREAGLVPGQSLGIVGWKYLGADEGDLPAFYIPAAFAHTLSKIVGDTGRLFDCTALLMGPETGYRAIVDADEIAMLEWGVARASAAVWRIVSGIRPGESELEAAARMHYAGEPLSCHMMLSSAERGQSIVGLASPTDRRLRRGDGVTTAVGYWGGLSCRAGLLSENDDTFFEKAAGYFEALCAWYEAVDIGIEGGLIYAAVEAKLATYGLRSALNPGHLLSIDEWSNTPIRPRGAGRIASGMPLQVDIIPVPMPDGMALNCEDAVVIADADLRAELAQRHPAVSRRIEARRAFMRNELGIDLKDCILPLSSTPMCLPPFWLTPGKLLIQMR